MTDAPTPAVRQFPCKQCGALLTYEPGTDTLRCPYCGTSNAIAASAEPIEELDYNAYLGQLGAAADTVEVSPVKCAACGAESMLAAGTSSGRCPFCGQPIVMADATDRRLIRPRSLLPFRVRREEAEAAFRRWLAGLWFAPGGLVAAADRGRLDGCYVPAWTYDCDTTTRYTGERGEDYWETETYTETVDGQSVTRTREVRKTRWWPASGRVADAFDDVLVLATDTLPPRCRDHLEPWDLPDLVPFREDYLAGFVTETYQVDLPQGFERAKAIMQPTIRRSIEADIGGDHQRIHTTDTAYRHVTFKHVLLPLWISAYTAAGRTYRFLVNARTGKVVGERPYSPWKIAAAVAVAVLLALLAVWLANRHG